MAAPHVSGLIALMVSADLQDGRRDLNVDELLAFMEYTALDLGPSGPDDEYGYGRIDAYSAVRWVLGAGDLRGTVRDVDSGVQIAGAKMIGTKALPGDRFTTQTGASGTYSTTVPGGTYDVHIEAFGYADRFDEKYEMVRSFRQGRYKYMRFFHGYYPDGLQNNYRYKMLAYQQWRTMFEAGQLSPEQAQFFQPKPAEAL